MSRVVLYRQGTAPILADLVHASPSLFVVLIKGREVSLRAHDGQVIGFRIEHRDDSDLACEACAFDRMDDYPAPCTECGSPKAECLRLARIYSADLADMSGGKFAMEVNVWAPSGWAWCATGSHELIVYNYADVTAGWTALLADLGTGLVPCAQPDCETCEEAPPVGAS